MLRFLASSVGGAAGRAAVGIAVGGGATWCALSLAHDRPVPFSESSALSNWSGTHSTVAARVYEPRDEADVVALLRDAAAGGRKLRPLGTALSPNGIGLCDSGSDAISLAHMDRVLSVDVARREVTVEAGARVSTVLQALAKHGLTLANFSSVQEQQMGGWTQVAAHGTGASLPTVEEQMVGMRLATPARGVLALGHDQNPRVFAMAKVGLGALGVVTQLTLRCVPSHRLHERTVVMDRDAVAIGHEQRLRQHRHVRYMWLPYTRDVVVVVSDPVPDGQPDPALPAQDPNAEPPGAPSPRPPPDLEAPSFAPLREQLLAQAPLSTAHVRGVNAAEASFWRQHAGERVADSTQVLGFECGGPQWVLEVCLPVPQQRQQQQEPPADIRFVLQLLEEVERRELPAPAPIEQRWTSGSTAPMSPAHAPAGPALFSWVGVIMYLPTQRKDRNPESEEGSNADIDAAFGEYTRLLDGLCDRFDAVPHWAKVEVPADAEQLQRLRKRLHRRYPIAEFAALRQEHDPSNVLGNRLVDTLLTPDMGAVESCQGLL